MAELEKGEYTGISQVYLAILSFEHQKEKCSRLKIVRLVAIDGKLVGDYLEFLTKERLIYKDKDDNYTTFTFTIDDKVFDKMAKTYKLNSDQRVYANNLINEMAMRQIDSTKTCRHIEEFLRRMKGGLTIRNGNEFLEVLRAINKSHDRFTFDSLSLETVQNTLKAKDVYVHKIKERVNDISETARRVAKLYAAHAKRNPELIVNGKLNRAWMEGSLKLHFQQYPSDTVDIELVIRELKNLPKPIEVSD